MTNQKFKEIVKKEINRIDISKTSKRQEIIFDGFIKEQDKAPTGLINSKKYSIFNSNDYLGLRHNEEVLEAEEEASKKYGAGPGAVRFIAGSMKVHKELENALAIFHKREDALIFSSAFAANLGVIQCFLKGQSKDSLISRNSLVISDALNHRSIIDGVRVSGLGKENKAIFKHLDIEDLHRVVIENKGKFDRVIIVTDGIFSMLGEYQDLKKLAKVARHHQNDFKEGIITIVDDSHGAAGFGKTGRGCEEYFSTKLDILVGTLGKGFGADGGYAVGDKVFIDFLRESAPTYIYSNPFSPGTAGAALKSVEIVSSKKGEKLIEDLNKNIDFFKEEMTKANFKFACDSPHPIQPVLIGDPIKCRKLTEKLFENKIIVTNLSYPVVPRGADEIRVQLSSLHTKKDILNFVENITACAKDIGII